MATESTIAAGEHTSVDLPLDLPDAQGDSVLLLDPNIVRIPDDMPNRDESSFNDEAFDELRRSILASGRNLQPIGVSETRQDDGSVSYRLVFGARRLRACRQSRLNVRAIVIRSDSIVDEALQRLHENRGRKDLTPFEFGRQVKHVLDGEDVLDGKKLTRAQLAERLGCHAGHIGRAYELACLPPQVLRAFAQPNDLRFEDMLPLKRAWSSNPQAVQAEVEIILQGEPPPAAKVVKRLVQSASNKLASCKPLPATAARAFQAAGRDVGKWHVLADGGLTLEISAAMSDAQREALVAQVAHYIERKVFKGEPKRKPTRGVATAEQPSSSKEEA